MSPLRRKYPTKRETTAPARETGRAVRRATMDEEDSRPGEGTHHPPFMSSAVLPPAPRDCRGTPESSAEPRDLCTELSRERMTSRRGGSAPRSASGVGRQRVARTVPGRSSRPCAGTSARTIELREQPCQPKARCVSAPSALMECVPVRPDSERARTVKRREETTRTRDGDHGARGGYARPRVQAPCSFSPCCVPPCRTSRDATRLPSPVRSEPSRARC